MRLRTFGFAFDKKKAPTALTPSDVFQSLESKSNLQTDGLLRFGITRYQVKNPTTKSGEEWWAGIVLKIRNAKNFTKLTAKDGKSVLTSEVLAVGDSLVEASFLLANPRSGAGLYANHHLAASFNSGFAPVLLDEFRKMQEARIDAIIKDPNLTGSERKKLQKPLRGFLWPSQLLLKDDFPTLVKGLKQVSKIRLRFKTLHSGKTLFRGDSTYPETETVEFKMPLGAVPTEVAASLGVAIKDDEIEKVSVYGLDDNDLERRVSTSKNPTIFADGDYDTIMSGLELDLNDFGPSLVKAVVIDKLAKLVQGKEIWHLLENS